MIIIIFFFFGSEYNFFIKQTINKYEAKMLFSVYFGNLHIRALEKYFPKRFRLLKIFTIIKQTHLFNLINILITYLAICDTILSIFL